MRLGTLEVSIVRDAAFRLDGGAMFGVVPKVLWERPFPADAKNRTELAHARAPNERDRASYRPEDWEPWAAAGRLETVSGEKEIRPGITVVPVRGHNAGMQAIRVDSGGRTLFYFADALPTSAHVPIPWIMAYDLYPVDLIENKKRLLEEAVRDQWLCVFEHDPLIPWGTIAEDPDGRRRVIPLPFSSG